MSSTVLKPDPAQRTLWYVQWSALFFVVLILLLIPAAASQTEGVDEIAIVLALSWTIIMVPVIPWINMYHRRFMCEVDDHEIAVTRGVIWRRQLMLPLDGVGKVEAVQNPLERILGIHRLKVRARMGTDNRVELTVPGLRDVGAARAAILGGRKSFTEVLGQSENLGDLQKLLVAMKQDISDLKNMMERNLSK